MISTQEYTLTHKFFFLMSPVSLLRLWKDSVVLPVQYACESVSHILILNSAVVVETLGAHGFVIS